MVHTIGVGVIGMGWMGQVHSRGYRQVRERYGGGGVSARLVICADREASRAQDAQERFGFERSTTDWRDVIADPAVDVVSVTTPNYLHREISEAAARAGKHVFCEKPCGRSLDDVLAIEEAVAAAGVLSCAGFNYRWAPVVQYAARLIADGQLGEITHFRGRFFAGYATDPRAVNSWRFQEEFAGFGTLGDLMPHVLDMALWLAGPIARLSATAHTYITRRPKATPGTGTHFTVGSGGSLEDVTNEDYVAVLAQFANGARGTFESCRVVNGPRCEFAFEVNGTQGALRWNFERMNELELYSASRGGFARVLSGPDLPDHAHFNPGAGIGLGFDDLKTIEAYHFFQSIVEQRQRYAGVREAAAVARVQSAIARSWESGRWEDVGPVA